MYALYAKGYSVCMGRRVLDMHVGRKAIILCANIEVPPHAEGPKVAPPTLREMSLPMAVSPN